MDNSKKNTYLFSIDALRVIAILAVIIIHVTTKTLQTLDHNILLAPYSLFLNQVSRFAVPLFFLISGFVLELNNKNNLSYITFFKKRASKIVTPFLFWSTIYFFIGWNFDFQKLLTLRFLQDILYGTASYHLYFIPTLILFYLAFPVLHLLQKFLKNPYVLFTILVLQFTIQIKDYYHGQVNIQENFRIALLSISVFILGMLASHEIEKLYAFIQKRKNILSILLALIIIVIFFHVKDLTLTRHTAGFIYNQYGPLNFLYTILLAMVLFYFLEKTKVLKRAFITLSKLSFFVFFIHVFILNLLWENAVTFFIGIYGKQILTNIWFDPLLFALISFFSFTIAYLVHKIPNAYKLTG